MYYSVYKSYCKIDQTMLSLSLTILRGLPLITYAAREGGEVKVPMHFHCVLHAKRGGGPDKIAYLLNGRLLT